VLIDPDINQAYLDVCQQQGVNLPAVLLNRYLLRLRKAGKLSGVPSKEPTKFDWGRADSYLFASEIAWRTVYDQTGASLDDIFCNPELAQLFDQTAGKFASGFSPFEYRWGALILRKAAKSVSMRSKLLDDPAAKLQPVEDFRQLNGQPGLYVVGAWDKKPLYVGEALDLGQVLQSQFTTIGEGWAAHGSNLTVRAVPFQRLPSVSMSARGSKLSLWLVAYQCRLVRKTQPKLNLLGLKDSTA
jgi:site-specific DNA-methyltransferase (adenine-specific)